MHRSALRARLALLLVLLTSIGLGAQVAAAVAVVDAAAPPDAVNDAETVRSGHQEFFELTGNDSDPDGDPLTITAPTPGEPFATAHGTVECFTFGDCEYVSNAGYTGPDSFSYTISDGTGSFDSATVSIMVLANTPPIAVDDVFEVTSGIPFSEYILGNDIDPDLPEGDFHTLTAPTPEMPTDTPHGTVTCFDYGVCEYTSDAGYVGPDGFDYTVADEDGASDSGHVAISVSAPGAPHAEDDRYLRGDELVLDVLENDSDDEDDPLEIASLTQPAGGTAEITEDKLGIVYRQTSNFTADDSFTYTVTDPGGATDTATVTLDACAGLASALDSGGIVVGERWVACSAERASGAVGPTTTVFPPQGGTSALLTSGDVAQAPGPNNSPSAGANNETELRGAFDVSILRLDLMIPAGADCLSFDLAFQSEEFPEYVNLGFNDAFLAELDTSNWSVEGATITAPHNFAFDSAGGIVSVNSAFFEPGRVVTATGSQYDGSTPLLNVRRSVTPGSHALFLSIFDAGDHAYDSAAFVDGLTAGPAGPGGCAAGANEPPNAVDDALESPEDTVTAPFNVLANDSDPDAGQTLAVTTLTPSAQHGTVACTADGMCTYTPAPNYHGPDSFSYGISDGHGGTDTATVSITVTPVNDEPVANADTLTTPKDTPGTVNVLANDTDVDGDTLAFAGQTHGAHGTVDCVASSCTYTPNPGYSGPDSFTYIISDGHGGMATGTVSVTVTAPPANQPPVADDETLTVAEDTSGDVSVLPGDTDPDGDPLTVTSPNPAASHGSVSCTAAGVCTYTPDSNYNGPDSFVYTVSDGNGGQDTGQVTVTVTPANDAPNAVNDSLTTAEDTAGNVNVLANDTDVDGDTLSVPTSTPTAQNGTVTCQATGACTYTPSPGYDGTDSFEYTISDGHGGSDTATVSVTVTPAAPPNTPPVADDETSTTPEDVPDSVNVLVGDTDADGDTLTVTSANPVAQHGTVACGTGGTCQYTPAANYHGPDGYDYTVSDGHGGTDTGHVSITVTPVSDDPNAVNDVLTTAEDTASASLDVLANDSDVDGDLLTVSGSTNGAHGTVVCGAGNCTYTPASNFHGSDSFTYTVSDGHSGTDTATVNVTVTPVNDPPNAVDDSFTTAQGTAKVMNVFGNDSDPDSPFMLIGTTQPANGSVFCTIAGDCTYTPNAGFTGSDPFTYTIGDGLADDTATVTMTVTAAPPANTPPSCANVTPSRTKLWPPRHKFIVVTLSGATDADGDLLTFSITKVTQDEKVIGAISKNDKGPDAQRVPGNSEQIKLRAERIASGNGRVYRIFYTVFDGQGGTCSGVEKVGVPKNKNGNAVDNRSKRYNSFG